MSAANYDVKAEQGASFYLKLTFKDPDGNRIDLTGNTYAGQVRRFTGDATILASMTFTLLDQTNPLTKGDVEARISSLDMASLPLKPQKTPVRTTEKFTYDIEVTKPSGDKDRVMQGVFEVSPEVTV